MRLRHLSITAAVLALAACGGAQDDTVPPESAPSEAAPVADIAVAGPERRILAFGDSLFAGYGLEEEEGYPEQLEDALRQGGINARVIDAGVSGDTSAAGRQRLAFTLDAQDTKPDLVLLELGGNDMLRGIQPDQTRANFAAMLDELQERDIPVLLRLESVFEDPSLFLEDRIHPTAEGVGMLVGDTLDDVQQALPAEG